MSTWKLDQFKYRILTSTDRVCEECGQIMGVGRKARRCERCQYKLGQKHKLQVPGDRSTSKPRFESLEVEE